MYPALFRQHLIPISYVGVLPMLIMHEWLQKRFFLNFQLNIFSCVLATPFVGQSVDFSPFIEHTCIIAPAHSHATDSAVYPA